MTPYSVVEHLAKAIFSSRWREGIFAVFSIYFDASGQEEQTDVKFLTVGGFIAPADVWIDFEARWMEALQRRGISEFHMAHCANYRFEFEGWRTKERDRRKLLEELVDILKSLSRWFSCTVSLADYRNNLEGSFRAQWEFKAYIMAARGCAARLKNWLQLERAPQLSNVQLLFEAGDNWQPELKTRLVVDGFPEPVFKPKRDRYSKKTGELIEHGLVQFQAADICAYMMNTLAKYTDKQTNDWGDKENIHWVLSALEAMPGQATTLDARGIAGTEKLLEICAIDLLATTSDVPVSSPAQSGEA